MPLVEDDMLDAQCLGRRDRFRERRLGGNSAE
jgi:hypothetical protein